MCVNMNKSKSHGGQRDKYNPAIHDKHKMPWTPEDDYYLQCFYPVDGMAMCALALGRTEMSVTNRFRYLKKKGAKK